jgi:hypothetical protein
VAAGRSGMSAAIRDLRPSTEISGGTSRVRIWEVEMEEIVSRLIEPHVSGDAL